MSSRRLSISFRRAIYYKVEKPIFMRLRGSKALDDKGHEGSSFMSFVIKILSPLVPRHKPGHIQDVVLQVILREELPVCMVGEPLRQQVYIERAA